MRKLIANRKLTLTAGIIAVVGLMTIPSLAMAKSSATTKTTTTPNSALSASEQQQHLANIKTKGDAEITRRLAQLNKLDGVIAAAVHLAPSDQAALTAEVNTEVSGLTALQTKLNSETTLSEAIIDAQSIISEYRVFALVTPKIWLIKTADDQQAVETKLTALSAKLQSRITADQTAGKNVASLQTTLNDMIAKTNAAQSISSSVESAVLPLQPSNYDADHSILSGYITQLNTARGDFQTAYTDAKTIVSDLKAL